MKNSKLLVTVISLVLVLAMLGGVCIFISADSSEVTLNVDTTKTVQITVDGDVKHTGAEAKSLSVKKNATVKVEALDDGFLYWTDGANNTVTGSKSYTFKIRSNTELTANFEAKEGCWIVYRNTNDTKQILASKTIASASDFTHFLDGANLFGHSFLEWDKGVTAVRNEINSGAKYVEIKPYYDKTAVSCTINAVNGTVNGGASATVNVLDEVTLTTTVSGPVYWVDSTGNVISDNATVKVTVIGDETYTAKSGTAEAAANVALTVQAASPDEISANGVTINATAKYFVPSGNIIKEHGLIYTKTATNKDLTLDTVDGTNVMKASFTKYSGMILTTFVNCTSHIYVRAYVVYSDGNNETVKYSSTAFELIDTNFSDDDKSSKEDTFSDTFSDTLGNAFEEYMNPSDSYTTGSGATLFTYSGKTATDYTNLCAKYESLGYTKYSSNDSMGNVKATTFIKGAVLAHVYFYTVNGNSEINIVKSNSEGSKLPQIPSITGSQTMTVVQLSAKNTKKNNGMGYVVRLADGSFIIYDGGYSNTSAKTTKGEEDEILEILSSLSGKSTGFHIRAWVITHGHGDHDSAFHAFMAESGSKVTLDHVFLSPVSNGDRNGLSNLVGTVSTTLSDYSPSTKICYVYTGMTIPFGANVKMEILLSSDEVYIDGLPYWPLNGTTPTPSAGVDGNDSSIISRIVKTGGKSMIFLGDSSLQGANKIVALYDTYAKSDYCQASHHGLENFTKAAYLKINPSVLFYPCNYSLYNYNSSASADGIVISSDRNYSVRKYLESGREILIRQNSSGTYIQQEKNF